MSKKIVSYEMGFNPETGKGNIHFFEEGNPNPFHLKGLPAEEFTALAAVLATDNAYGNGEWIHTGLQAIGTRFESADFEIPKKYQ